MNLLYWMFTNAQVWTVLALVSYIYDLILVRCHFIGINNSCSWKTIRFTPVLTFGYITLHAKFESQMMSRTIDNNCSCDYLAELVIFTLASTVYICLLNFRVNRICAITISRVHRSAIKIYLFGDMPFVGISYAQ